jgi:hypothetical protein
MKAQTATSPQHTATDAVLDRVVDILDAHTDIGILDCPDGRTILTWKTTTELATAIASDPQLAALIRQQQLGSVA